MIVYVYCRVRIDGSLYQKRAVLLFGFIPLFVCLTQLTVSADMATATERLPS